MKPGWFILLLSVLTLFLNTVIQIRIAGEDSALWQLEMDTINHVFSGKTIHLRLFEGYYQSLPLTALLSFIGQILLVISLFIKDRYRTEIIKISLITLWVGILAIAVSPELVFVILKSLFFLISSVLLFLFVSGKLK